MKLDGKKCVSSLFSELPASPRETEEAPGCEVEQQHTWPWPLTDNSGLLHVQSNLNVVMPQAFGWEKKQQKKDNKAAEQGGGYRLRLQNLGFHSMPDAFMFRFLQFMFLYLLWYLLITARCSNSEENNCGCDAVRASGGL